MCCSLGAHDALAAGRHTVGTVEEAPFLSNLSSAISVFMMQLHHSNLCAVMDLRSLQH